MRKKLLALAVFFSLISLLAKAEIIESSPSSSGSSGTVSTGTAGQPAVYTGTNTVGSVATIPVANGGTNASSAGITAFNNITGYTASGATGTTSTNLVFSASPTFTTGFTLNAGTITTDTTTGLKIGGATGQKLGFFNATPVAQQTGNICTAATNLGLVTSCTESGGSNTVAIGTSAITGGTTTRVLFDNAAVVGEYSVSGTGNVVMSASPTMTGTVTAANANFSGNVGIGTTNPAVSLDIQSGALHVANNSSSVGYLGLYDDGAGHISADTTSGGYLYVSASGTFFRATATGSNNAFIAGLGYNASYFNIGGGGFGIGLTSPQTALDVNGAISIHGTTFTASGCSVSTLVGGTTAGSFHSGTTGACTVTVTMGTTSSTGTQQTASNGWACSASDQTTPANLISQKSGGSTTTAIFTGTTVSGDVISFSCIGY